MKYCYHIYDKEAGKVLIPGCIGAAAMGYESCRCKESNDKKGDQYNEIESLKAQLKTAEKYIKHLKKELNGNIKNRSRQSTHR